MTRHPAPPPAEHSGLDADIHASVGGRTKRYMGMAMGLIDGGADATAGFGHIRAGGNVPGPRTSFQIGSVTKVFTGLLLADAAGRGEVDLDQPLDTLIPHAASHPDGPPIRLVDLATHTSGLPRLPPGLVRQALRNRDDPYARFTTDDLDRALAVTPKRPPGGRPRYSNYGAGVLGDALTRATGLAYAELVQERIAGPLGLADTRIAPDGSEDSVAVGHTRRGRATGDWHLPALAGAGALRSSVRDQLTFLHACLDPDSTPLGDVIRDTLTPRTTARGPLSVGLNWHILERRDGARWWWHNGGTGGFTSFLGFDPDTRRGVVVLSNTARSVDPIGQRLLTS